MSLGLYVIPTCFKKATIVLVPEKLQPHGNNLYCCTKIPTKIVTKLQDLGLDSHLCTWILNLLTGRPQMVQIGSLTSSCLTLSTGAPQGWMLSPLLSSLFIYDCVAQHTSNRILKFADGHHHCRSYLGCWWNGIQKRGQRPLASCCPDNNLSLNISKTLWDHCGLQEETGGWARPYPHQQNRSGLFEEVFRRQF